jgi:hypothetical protein
MTEAEIKDWLGVGDIDRQLLPQITEGMAGVPFPEDDAGHMDVFTAFLRCSPEQGKGIFVTGTQEEGT